MALGQCRALLGVRAVTELRATGARTQGGMRPARGARCCGASRVGTKGVGGGGGGVRTVRGGEPVLLVLWWYIEGARSTGGEQALFKRGQGYPKRAQLRIAALPPAAPLPPTAGGAGAAPARMRPTGASMGARAGAARAPPLPAQRPSHGRLMCLEPSSLPVRLQRAARGACPLTGAAAVPRSPRRQAPRGSRRCTSAPRPAWGSTCDSERGREAWGSAPGVRRVPEAPVARGRRPARAWACAAGPPFGAAPRALCSPVRRPHPHPTNMQAHAQPSARGALVEAPRLEGEAHHLDGHDGEVL